MTTADERGSGTVLVTAVAGTLLIVSVAVVQIGAAASAAHRARAAADLSALAAASALQQGLADPCGRAEELASRNAARLQSCRLTDGASVQVRVLTDVSAGWPGVARTATASARAGPAQDPAQ
ncbi:flp pilus-assembly TadE/G-like family protein [Knoellia locipacati]|uniref:Rv3654c family TadE-like protein n=1 Tax=Knoellia locipacati TaxID=882824 RepID=UPI00384CEBD6